MDTYTDYLMLLPLPAPISAQVAKFKQASARLIGDFEGMHSPACLALKHLSRQKPFSTRQVMEQLERELSQLEPMALQLNGFATFLPTDYTTIYAAIRSTPAMEDWFKRLRGCLNEKKSVPHITIARQVPHERAKKLWPQFKDRRWAEEFEVTALTLLCRETYAHDKTWKPYKNIPFRGDRELNRFLPKQQAKPAVKVDIDQQRLF